MTELTIEQIQSLLSEGRYRDFIGTVESPVFDAKRQPYSENDKGKQDLATDVCAFANAGGGIIVMGLNAPRNPGVSQDPVIEIHSFPSGLISAQAYMNLLNDWVYPAPQGVKIDVFEDNAEDGKVYASILVPPQDETRKPFLVAKTLNVDTQKRSHTLFGYSVRNGTSNETFKVEEFYGVYKKGMNSEKWIADELRDVRAAIEKIGIAGPDKSKDAEVIEKNLLSLRTTNELDESRALGIAFIPDERIELSKLLNDSNDGARAILRNHARYRNYGWDLSNFDTIKPGPGYISAKDNRRKALRLSKDGSLYMTASLERSYLAHASPEGEHRLNAVSIIELITHVTEFYEKALKELGPLFAGVTIYIRLWGMRPEGEMATRLKPYTNDDGWFRDGSAAETDTLSDEFTLGDFPARGYIPGRLAFLVVERLYSLFGLGTDAIPYTDGDGFDQHISVEKLKAI